LSRSKIIPESNLIFNRTYFVTAKFISPQSSQCHWYFCISPYLYFFLSKYEPETMKCVIIQSRLCYPLFRNVCNIHLRMLCDRILPCTCISECVLRRKFFVFSCTAPREFADSSLNRNSKLWRYISENTSFYACCCYNFACIFFTEGFCLSVIQK
jgi:hypothetical protein